MKRVLFVDGEPNILDGLRRSLRPQRKAWEMVFVEGGEAALRELEKAPFDVIVTDMRMPGMDGAALLSRVKETHPRTARFVLSGHTELDAAMRAVPVAHQFLSKPCELDVLRDVVARACELETLLNDELVTRLVGEIDSLPSVPETYAAVTKALADPDVDLRAVAAIIERDPGMSLKILHLVNSSFFGLPCDVTSIERAVSYLGTNVVRDLVLTMEVFRPPPGADRSLEEFTVQLQRRSALTASIARRMFEQKHLADQAFLAGMLHDVGSLILATRLPEQFAENARVAAEQGRPLHEVEQERYGATHGEVGAYLLALWGLPYPLLEASAYHHRPSRLSQEGFGILTAVHVAGALVEAKAGSPASSQPDQDGVDLEYIASLGLDDRLEEWEALADEQLSCAKPED